MQGRDTPTSSALVVFDQPTAADARRGTLARASSSELNRRDSRGQTKLHRAVQENNVSRAIELVQAGADVDSKNRHGETALMLCVSQKNAAMCCALLESGANANVRNASGFPALVLASSLTTSDDGSDVVRAIASAAPHTVNAFAAGYTALHWASINNSPQSARALVDAGADLDLPSEPEGQTPLFKAAVYSNVQCLRVLTEAGADVDAADRTRRTACHILAANGCLDGITILLAAGAAHSAIDERGRTPARLALDAANLRILHALVMAGASLSGDASQIPKGEFPSGSNKKFSARSRRDHHTLPKSSSTSSAKSSSFYHVQFPFLAAFSSGDSGTTADEAVA